jgi:hypothetical protein
MDTNLGRRCPASRDVRHRVAETRWGMSEALSGFTKGADTDRETHDVKMAAFVRGVLWAIKRTAEMKGRIVDELDVDVDRRIILAVLRGLSSDGGLHEIIERTSNLLVYSTKPSI